MAPIRQSNLDRRRERDLCREKLSEHIYNKLGLRIQPSEIRLCPRANESYTWQAISGKEEFFAPIFAKNLSDHSTGTYRLLCKEVGKTFEAVSFNNSNFAAETITSLSSPGPSFNTVISSLNKENENLRRDICDLETRVHSEVQQRQTAEEKLRNLQLENDELQAQLDNCSSTLANLETGTQRHVLLLEQVMPLLEKLRHDVSKQKVVEYTSKMEVN